MNGSSKHSIRRVEETFRDFWRGRPARPRQGGKIAGVAAALGDRYGIDPLLVRVIFVVGAFYGGAGIVLYLLGWLVLPKEGSDGGTSKHTGTAGMSVPMLVLLTLLLIPAVFGVFDWAGLLGLALGGTALYLLHRNHRERRIETTGHLAEHGAEPGASARAAGVSAGTGADSGEAEQQGGQPGGRVEEQADGQQPDAASAGKEPPAWDPLGAAPFAWDLPEPALEQPAEPVRKRPRRSVTLVTSALALLAGLLALASKLPLGTALVIMLGVLGAGMIAGAFLRGGRGLIALAIPLALLAGTTSTRPAQPGGDFTSVRYSPETPAQLRDSYAGSLGSLVLHLQGLRVPDGQTLRTRAHIDSGSVVVYLPPEMDVRLDCSAGRGRIDCLGEQQGGPGVHVATTDLGADGAGGGNLVLDVSAGTGNVEVLRG